MGGEFDVALELQDRVLANRVVRRKEGAELEPGRSAPGKTTGCRHVERVGPRVSRPVSEASDQVGGLV